MVFPESRYTLTSEKLTVAQEFYETNIGSEKLPVTVQQLILGLTIN